MNNIENQNGTHNNNDASIATTTDEKVENCIKDIMRHHWFRRMNEDGKIAVRNVVYSIHRKEWEQSGSHFLQIYDNDNV